MMKPPSPITFRPDATTLAALEYLLARERAAVRNGSQIKAARQSDINRAAIIEYAMARGFNPRGKESK